MTDRALLPNRRPKQQLFNSRDLYLLGYLPCMAIIAWLVPESCWEPLCGHAVRQLARLRRRGRARLQEDIVRFLGEDSLAADVEGLVAAWATNYHQSRLQLLRTYIGGGWRPCIQLSGQEHLDHALAGSRGVILWVAPSMFSGLVTKMAFHQAGYRVSHLSRPGHGFSDTRFGVRVLNPIVAAAERHYVAERLVMESDQSIAALRVLMSRVQENGLVSITVSRLGRRTHTVPFFHDTIRLADGAPSLAERTGAALLPVSTARTVSRTFVTTIHPPLQVPRDVDRSDRVPALMRQCAGWLEWYVRTWPDQYTGWDL